ncbi:MAG: ABC transporter permease [candidate division Zixibacteria bacterium HGW-Zixibacteria-1]|nr:MAG: ABC transporter permease [candidate division Zixibacteria bacterium HGW-Zixibacteria-1]
MLPLLSIKQFFRDMRNQKLRTFMTMFGILWGTAAVILLMGFGTGMYKAQMKRFKGLGENISIIWPGLTSKPWKGLPRGRRVMFTEDDVARIKAAVPSILRISPEYARGSIPMKTGKNNLVARVAGVWPEFCDMRSLIPQEGGRFINALDMVEKKRVVFLGNRLAERLFGQGDHVGKIFMINNVPFTVIGIMKEKDQNSSYSGRDYNHAWIPASTYRTMWSNRYPQNMIVQAPRPDMMGRVKQEIKNVLGSKYNFDPKDTEALMIWDTTEGFKFFATFFLAFRAFLVGIGCMTLVTGGIGVSNIMNVVLEERTKEIGIKMAMGAKKRVIMSQFMFETILLTAIGGTLGFLMAFGLMKALPPSLTEDIGEPTITFSGALMAVGIVGLIALVSGFFPARRAANLEPVKALKLF